QCPPGPSGRRRGARPRRQPRGHPVPSHRATMARPALLAPGGFPARAVVWEWLNEHGRWRPYSAAVSHHLEQALQEDARGRVPLGPADAQLAPYVIDLQAMHQLRQDTGKGTGPPLGSARLGRPPLRAGLIASIPAPLCLFICAPFLPSVQASWYLSIYLSFLPCIRLPRDVSCSPSGLFLSLLGFAGLPSAGNCRRFFLPHLFFILSCLLPPPWVPFPGGGRPVPCSQQALGHLCPSLPVQPESPAGCRAHPGHTSPLEPGCHPAAPRLDTSVPAGMVPPRCPGRSGGRARSAAAAGADAAKGGDPIPSYRAALRSRGPSSAAANPEPSWVPALPVKNLNSTGPVHPALAGMTGILLCAAGLPVCLTRAPKPVLHPPPVSKSDIKPVPGVSGICRKTKKKHLKKSKNPEDVVRRYVQKVKNPPDEDCTICMERLGSASGYEGVLSTKGTKAELVGKLGKCGHVYHVLCLVAMYSNGNKDGSLQCPTCKAIYGEKTGTQPPGKMEFHLIPHSLPGHSDSKTIRIVYDIPTGIQRGGGVGGCAAGPSSRRASWPCPTQVLKLLLVAWERRLIFTVGTSSTTGESDTVVWNEIHHKTEFGSNLTGHGYPDPNYLDNVLAELLAQGVSEANIKD
ncbi:DTX1 ligase, partial [Nothoprocta pentlandii]|nr:DTX1 ligase [Nothoprocta pentlandii]